MERSYMKKIIAADNSLPLFLQIKEYIFEELKAMNLKSGDKIPSENDFCHKSNVSIRTVRRALTELGKDGVIVRRQGQGSFLLDINANAKPASTGTIGILFSDMNYVVRPVFSRLLQSIEAQVLEQGYSFHLYSTGDRLHQTEKRPLEQIIPLETVKGLIATSALSKEDIQTLRRCKIPLVAFNEYNDLQLNSVIFDYYSAARMGIEYLWKTGHKNIAFICRHFGESDSPAIFNNDNFLRGIKDTFAENNLFLDKNMIFQSDAMRKDGKNIATELFRSANPPDAIFTVDDFLAQGTADVIKENNFDCNVISCGMLSELENISSVEIPVTEWGETAVNLLIRNIKGDASVKKTKLIKAKLTIINKQNKKAI
jgi:DNA-binding LacI/PurR family transcriptional regulator